MRLFRLFLIALILSPIASAQPQKNILTYPAAGPIASGDLIVMGQGGQLVDATAMQMLNFVQTFFTFNFSNIGTGTNTSGAMICGSGCSLSFSGSGTINANQIGGLAVPASAFLLASNSSSQLTTVSASPTGCGGGGTIVISSAQIAVNCVQPTVLNYSQINAIGCPGAGNLEVGVIYDQNDALAISSTTRGGAMQNSASSHIAAVICTDAGWQYL